MDRYFRKIIASALIAVLVPNVGFSEELDSTAPEVVQTDSEEALTFNDKVKDKYKLTDEQMKALADAGIKGPHAAMTAQLAASSGKSVDEVIKMRTEQNMGWGKIAKELGVHPRELGQSVSSLRHKSEDDHSQRKEAREARKIAQEQKRAERAERKAERKERRAERKAEKKEKS